MPESWCSVFLCGYFLSSGLKIICGSVHYTITYRFSYDPSLENLDRNSTICFVSTTTAMTLYNDDDVTTDAVYTSAEMTSRVHYTTDGWVGREAVTVEGVDEQRDDRKKGKGIIHVDSDRQSTHRDLATIYLGKSSLHVVVISFKVPLYFGLL